MTGAEFELYDVRSDPAETQNIADTHPEVVARLRRAIDDWLSGKAPVPVSSQGREMSEAERELLVEWGYLD